ncbi:hypothetical protein J6590_017964 [Homalodisca vitripennis]|nr:hypothetical protein J6590_017964 [Homalodisca vitripennis]
MHKQILGRWSERDIADDVTSEGERRIGMLLISDCHKLTSVAVFINLDRHKVGETRSYIRRNNSFPSRPETTELARLPQPDRREQLMEVIRD